MRLRHLVCAQNSNYIAANVPSKWPEPYSDDNDAIAATCRCLPWAVRRAVLQHGTLSIAAPCCDSALRCVLTGSVAVAQRSLSSEVGETVCGEQQRYTSLQSGDFWAMTDGTAGHAELCGDARMMLIPQSAFCEALTEGQTHINALLPSAEELTTRCSALRAIEPAALASVLERACLQRFEAGAVLLRRGEVPQCAWLVLAGSCAVACSAGALCAHADVQRSHERDRGTDATVLVAADAAPGLSGAVLRAPLWASVQASTPVTVLAVPLHVLHAGVQGRSEAHTALRQAAIDMEGAQRSEVVAAFAAALQAGSLADVGLSAATEGVLKHLISQDLSTAAAVALLPFSPLPDASLPSLRGDTSGTSFSKNCCVTRLLCLGSLSC